MYYIKNPTSPSMGNACIIIKSACLKHNTDSENFGIMSDMKTIALFSENAREYGRQFLKGVAHYALGRRNWRLRLLSPGEIGNRRAFAGVDGIIARIIGEEYIAQLKATGLPVVDAFCELDDPALIGVDNDHTAIGKMAAEYFMQRGFRSFAYCGYRGTRYSDNRLAAYSAALRHAGFPCAEFAVHEPPTNAIFFNEEAKPPRNNAKLRKWVAALPPRTAVFCANDLRAYHVLCAAQEIGRGVPDDLAVLGVDNDDLLCSYASVAISSIDPNAFGVGHAAARLMDAALSHPERPKARPTFKVKPGTLVERTSTAVFPVDPPWFATALSYIETHMSSPVSTVDAARAAGVSQTALQTAFHANFGMSAGKYIRGVKMREARRLIATSELSVKEIAARTGFVSHPHFSRTYRAHFGLPPSHPVSD